jgi:hypothetical protein
MLTTHLDPRVLRSWALRRFRIFHPPAAGLCAGFQGASMQEGHVCRRGGAHSGQLPIGAPVGLVQAQVGPSGVFPNCESGILARPGGAGEKGSRFMSSHARSVTSLGAVFSRQGGSSLTTSRPAAVTVTAAVTATVFGRTGMRAIPLLAFRRAQNRQDDRV